MYINRVPTVYQAYIVCQLPTVCQMCAKCVPTVHEPFVDRSTAFYQILDRGTVFIQIVDPGMVLYQITTYFWMFH